MNSAIQERVGKMLKLWKLMACAGVLLAVWGAAIIGLDASALVLMSNAAPTASAFDQGDDIIVPDGGAAPVIAPTQSTPGEQPTMRALMTLPSLSSGESATATPMVSPSSTPIQMGLPERLIIPAIKLDAPIVEAGFRYIKYQGKIYPQWIVPNSYSVGWSTTSARPGDGGNTVLFGHHNEFGEVFGHLVDLQVNDVITLSSGERDFRYVIALKLIMPERNEPIEIRLQNASWILPSQDERLTLLTCWPQTTNTHRLIIVAVPITPENLKKYSLSPRLIPSAP